MLVENGKIVEVTEEELYRYWLKTWSDFMPFDEYCRRMKNEGVKITNDSE